MQKDSVEALRGLVRVGVEILVHYEHYRPRDTPGWVVDLRYALKDAKAALDWEAHS